jgi:YVTN family beta-propeller protein
MKFLSLFVLSTVSTVSTVFGVIPHVYVTDELGSSITVIDVSNDTVQQIFGFDQPHVVKVTPDGTTAYVGDSSNTVYAVDTITNTVSPMTVSLVGGHALSMAITPDSNFLYTANSNDTVTVIQTSDNTIVTTLTGFDGIQDIKISPDGTFAYVTNSASGTVSIISISANTVVGTITGFGKPIGLTFTIDGTFAYVTDNSHNSVYVIEVATNAISDVVLGLNLPSYAAVSPDKSTLYVSNSGNNTVSVIRLSDNLIVSTIPIPQPKSLGVTQDGQFLYVGSDFGDVFKVTTLEETIVVAIPGFQNPSNMTFTTNNVPANTVNGWQVPTDPTNIYNQVSWLAAPGSPISYKVYRDVEQTLLIDTVLTGAPLLFNDMNRLMGQSYTYYVVAEYANGFSSTIGSVEVNPVRVGLARM